MENSLEHVLNRDAPPGPDFLASLELRFSAEAPQILARAARTLDSVSHILGLSHDETAILSQGFMAYHLLFVETALELNGAPLLSIDDAAVLQLLALIHWRNVDVLHDADRLELDVDRHRELAEHASVYVRERSERLGIDWAGWPGKQYQAFQTDVRSAKPSEALPAKDLTETFLRDHFEHEPGIRASFLFFMPRHLLRIKEADLDWYSFYTFVVTLDDDLDDALADAIAGRNTPTVRYLTSLGVFNPGRARSFPTYCRFLTTFLVHQLDLCMQLAIREQLKAAFINLAVLRDFTLQKLQEV
jgi:hypothetical protein